MLLLVVDSLSKYFRKPRPNCPIMKPLVYGFKLLPSNVLSRHPCVTALLPGSINKILLPLLKVSVITAKLSMYHPVLGTWDLAQRCHHLDTKDDIAIIWSLRRMFLER